MRFDRLFERDALAHWGAGRITLVGTAPGRRGIRRDLRRDNRLNQ
jgi:hypothetical protein